MGVIFNVYTRACSNKFMFSLRKCTHTSITQGLVLVLFVVLCYFTYQHWEGSFNLVGVYNAGQQSTLDIVISGFRFSMVHWQDIRNILSHRRPQPRWILYQKGNWTEAGIYNSSKTGSPCFNEVYSLPNIGREGHTFLHHIVNRYNELAKHTLFCQETPHYPDIVKQRLTALFHSQTGFLSLGHDCTCTCEGQCYGQLKLLPQLYAMFRGQLCVGTFFSSLTGCFVVSRSRIQEHSRETYVYLLDMMKDGKSFINDQEHYQPYPFTGGASSDPSNPAFGHVIERSWAFIFNCTDANLAYNTACNDLGTCVGPQCLDY